MQNSVTYTIIIDLVQDTWLGNVASDTTKRQQLVDAVLSSDRLTSTFGYERAFAKQRLNYNQANVVRNSNTRVTITVPQFATYALVAHGSETISAQALPASTVTSGVLVNLRSGATSVSILGRTASFSGTFFSLTPKLDDDLRSAKTFNISVTLVAEQWADDVISNPVTRQAVVDALLHSNQAQTVPGYENAWQKMTRNFNASFMNLTNGNLTLHITIPQFSDYISGREKAYWNSNELISALDVPAVAIKGDFAISAARMFSGVTSVAVNPRSVRFTGSFFVESGKNAEDIQNAVEWTIYVDLYRETWQNDIATSDVLRQTLVDHVLRSDHSRTEARYELAWP